MSKEQLPFHNEKDETKSALMGAAAEPVNAVSAAEPPKKMWPGYIIMIWIALSSSVIMQSEWSAVVAVERGGWWGG